MQVPVLDACGERSGQLDRRLETSAFAGQRIQLFPPRLNQVEPGRILGQKENLELRPSQQGRLHIPTGMRAFSEPEAPAAS